MVKTQSADHPIGLATGLKALKICRNTFTTGLPMVVIGLFLFTLISGIFLPIYSDELVAKWSIARFFLEDGKIVSLLPQCTTTTGRYVSAAFYPAGILISAVYANLQPLGVRIAGITLSIFWFLLLGYWYLKQPISRLASFNIFTAFVALASLGVMPYLWILSRAEQIIILPVLIFCFYAVVLNDKKTTVSQYSLGFLFLILASCFYYIHPKSLFYSPFILVSIWLATETFKKGIRYVLIAFVCVLIFSSYQDSTTLAACQDAPYVQQMLAANTLLPKLLFTSPVEFGLAAFNNILGFPEKLMRHLIFNASSQSGWIPPITYVSNYLGYINDAVAYLLLALVVGSHLISLIVFGVQLVRSRINRSLLLATLLALAGVANVMFYNIWNFYTGAQFIPLSLTIVMLLLHSFGEVRYSGKILCWVYYPLLVISIASMIALLSLVTPEIIRNSSSDTASIPGQPLSLPVFSVAKHVASIKALGESCGIPTEHATNVVVDHMTYFAYLQNKNPIHVLYISEFGYGGDLGHGRLLPFLKKLESPGIITRCEWMPTEFRYAQKRNDMDYCCVGLNTLK